MVTSTVNGQAYLGLCDSLEAEILMDFATSELLSSIFRLHQAVYGIIKKNKRIDFSKAIL
ncbi:MAG: hypothetical protein QHH14_01075 [Clostridiales bacterium]|nr:hypothetical protein [Clostridiales bacterium]